MIEVVDDDGSGCIEFQEFLSIIEMSDEDKTSNIAKINQFFKDMSNGKFGSEGQSFNLIV